MTRVFLAAVCAMMLMIAGSANAAGGAAVRVGGTVDIRDDMAGELIAGAGSTNIEGRIAGGAVIAAGRINIAGTVQDDVVAIGGAFTLWPQAQIGGDLRLASGDAEISGAVGGDLVVAAGSVVVAGQIGGDIRTLAGKVIVLPGAVIGGRIVTHGPGSVEISPNARVLGGSAPPEGPPPKRNRENHSVPHALIGGALLFAFLRLPVIGLATLIVGLLFLAIFPRFAEASAGTLRGRPGTSFIAGFVALACAPLAVGLLIVTILGIPVALLVTAAFLLVLVASYGMGAVALASIVWQRLRAGGTPGLSLPAGFWWRAVQLVLGLAVLGFIRHLPIAGFIVFWVTTALGLGAIAIETWHRWRGASI
jgi:cytoskeletal protein CcmA (bactofilin family)